MLILWIKIQKRQTAEVKKKYICHDDQLNDEMSHLI